MGRAASIFGWGGKWVRCAALAPWLFLGLKSLPPRVASASAKSAPESLIEWRDMQIAWILRPDDGSPNRSLLSRREVIAKCGAIFDELQAKYGSDLGILHSIPGADVQMSNFVRFVTAQHWQGVQDADGNGTHLLGGSMTDLEYLKSIQPYVQPPPLLADQAFLDDLRSPATYYKALDMIQARNRAAPPSEQWLTLTFRGQFILSVDRTTYGRLLVVIPSRKLPDGSELEQWFQFALATPDTPAKADVKSVSCVARVRRPGGESDGYFVDLFRIRDGAAGEISFQPTYVVKPMPSSDCFNCHKTAVLPIYPNSLLVCRPGGVSESPVGPGTDLEAINARMLAWYRGHDSPTNLPSERTLVDAEAYGPCLGSGGSARLDAPIAAESGLSPASAARIRSAMSCTKCHGAFAPLNYDLSVETDRDTHAFESKRGLAQTFVENGTMPPGNDLSSAERKVLWRALAKAYFDPRTRTGMFVDWLKGGF